MRQSETRIGRPGEGDLAGREEDVGALGSGSRSRFNLRAIWATLYRNRIAIMLIVAASALIGLASILFTPRVYQAMANMQIDQPIAPADRDEKVAVANSDRFLQTQVDILQSRGMAKRVAERLRLAASDDFLVAVGAATSDVTSAERENTVIDALLEHRTIDLPTNSRIVSVFFRSRDPAISTKVANTYAREFIEGNIQREFSTGDYARRYLQNQLGLAKDRLDASERSLISYARSARLIDFGNGAIGRNGQAPSSLTAANLIQLNGAVTQARASRLQAQQRWEQSADVPAATLPEALSNQAMQNLLQQRAELGAQIGEMRQHMTRDHPAVLRASAQLNELDRQTRALGESIRNSIRIQYLTAQRQEAAIQEQVNALKAATLSEQDLGVRYNILRREVDTNRQLYDRLLQRFKELSVDAGVTTNNITVVDAAEVPRRPVSPRPLLNMALALSAGLILALLYAFGREKLDDAVRDPREVEGKLHLPMLGVIPEVTDGSLQEALDTPYSDVAEAYYGVRTSVELSSNQGLPSSLLVTSSNTGEGKSTTSYVLARDLARVGRKVLLIDADLRHPSLHRHFDTSAGGPGLSSVLARLIPAAEAIQAGGEATPAFLSSGPLPPDPANLFAGTAVKNLLAELASHYDVIVIDGPPAIALADAVELASATAATIFVVEAGAAHFGQARTAVARLVRSRARLIGCVVTKYNARKVGYTDDNDYYSYSYSKEA